MPWKMSKSPARLWLGALSFILLSFGRLQAAQWEEIRLQDEIVLRREAGARSIRTGQIFAQQEKTTLILAAADLEAGGVAAVADLERYLPLACGCKVTAGNDMAMPAEFTIVLATTRSSELLGWLGVSGLSSLGEQECRLVPSRRFPNKSQGIALIGGSARGLLDGVYTLLEKSAEVYWEPLRSNFRPGHPPLNLSETELKRSRELHWDYGEITWKPAVADRVLYIASAGLRRQAIDWASRNRLSHVVISTPHQFPLPEAAVQNLKSQVSYAQGLGLKVLFLNVTHRLPETDQALPPSSPEAVALSTKLFRDLFIEFHLDGMAWHTSTEGIKLPPDKDYPKKSRPYWEAQYFNSYYSAIRSVKPDAQLVMLMGWAYMNPASRLARQFPPDTIAWVVPNTSLIDAARTDLDEYGKHFRQVWYWLYVRVSQDGPFPTVKLDYLEANFREAIRRNHGLAPQGLLYGNNSADAMYFAQVAREGLLSPRDFLNSFADRFYGSARMGQALLAYQEALLHHRNWNDNIHTTGPKKPLSSTEVEWLYQTVQDSLTAMDGATCSLFKDRLRVMAITALRCIWRGSIRNLPQVSGQKTRKSKMSKDEAKKLGRFEQMLGNFERIHGRNEEGHAEDVFWEELREIKKVLEK